MIVDWALDAGPRTMTELRAEHRELMTRFANIGSSTPGEEFLTDVEQFRSRAVRLGAVLDQEADRRAAQNLLDYWTTVMFRADPDAPPALLDRFDPACSPELPESACPYVGLGPFQEDDSLRFFGRRQLVEELVGMLAEHRLLAVVGPSGSGKSSVVRAGLVPRLRANGLEGSGDWHYYPAFVPGAEPLRALARAVRPDTSDDDEQQQWVEQQIEGMRADPTHLVRLLRSRQDTALLIVDQFEELYTFDRSEREHTRATRRAFLDNLLCVLREADRAHRVIVTLRDDCVEYVGGYEVWNEIFGRGRIDVPPLSISQLREAIEAPAERVGLRFDDGVIDNLLDGVVGQPAALPLLQFALHRLWKRRWRTRITLASYQELTQAPHGQAGVLWALANAAETFYEGLPLEYQGTVRRILVHLVQPGDEWEPRSRRVWRSELFELGEDKRRVRLVLEKLEQEQLVRVTEPSATSDDVEVELAHEALARNWPGLSEWLSDDWARRVARRRLTLRTADWIQAGRTKDLLLRGSLLEEAEQHRNLSADEQQYVNASRLAENLRQTAQLRQIKKLHHLTVGLVAALVIVAVLAALALRLADEANASRVVADTKSLMAQSRALAAHARLSTTSQFDLGLLLGLQGLHEAPTSEARGAVLAALDQNPRLMSYFVEPATASAQAHTVSALAYGSDGLLVSGESSGAVSIWDSATRTPRATLQAAATTSGAIGRVAYSADRSLIAGGDTQDGGVQLWDASSGALLSSVAVNDEHIAAAVGVAFRMNGQRLVAASNLYGGSAREWDISDARHPVELVHIDVDPEVSIAALATSLDGSTLAAALNDADRTIVLWNAQTGETEREMPGGTETVNALSFSPDGNYLAAGGANSGVGGDTGVVRVWDLRQTDASPLRLTGQLNVRSLAFTPDSAQILSGSCSSVACAQGEIRLWDIAQGRMVSGPLHGHAGAVFALAVAPDGKTVVSAGADGTTIEWNIQPSAGPLRALPLPIGQSGVLSLAASPDGGTLATTASDGSITLWNLSTSAPQTTIGGLSAPAASLAFSPSGGMFVSSSCPGACKVGQIQLWDSATHLPIGQPLPGHSGAVRSVAFSPSGKLLVSSGSTDQSIILWDVQAGTSVGGPLQAPAGVDSLAFSPDARLLVSGQADGSVVFWDVANHSQLGQPVGAHGGLDVTSLAFSPDGRKLASAGADGMVVLWDVAKQIPDGAPLSGQVGAVRTVAFNQDGTILASGGDDRRVHFWDVASHEELTAPSAPQMSTITGVAFVTNSQGNEQLISAGSHENKVDVWPLPVIPPLSEAVCRIANRNLSQREWTAFVPDQPYQRTCPELADGPA
jgi:WD40 repeat protein